MRSHEDLDKRSARKLSVMMTHLLVKCVDDITGKEVPKHAVKKARDLDLIYVRDMGVYEKVKET